MIKVYCEDAKSITSWQIATFDNEEIYEKCFPILEQYAKSQNAKIIESVENE